MKKKSKRKKKKTNTKKRNALTGISPKEMRGFSSIYLDVTDKGYKISIWSGKKGIIEGLLSRNEMPPFIRMALVKRTEAMNSGESIEIIGKNEADIASIASEPIDIHTNGNLSADISKRNGEIHLKITLEETDEYTPLYSESHPDAKEVNIDHLATKLNEEIKKNLSIADFEEKASKLLTDLRGVEKLKKDNKDKKLINSVRDSSASLSSLSRRYGFIRIYQLSESMSILFETYWQKGEVEKASLPTILKTVNMLEKMVEDISGADVDSLISRISRNGD